MRPERALDLVRERAGPEVVERIEHLDAARTRRSVDADLSPPDVDARIEADVVVAGGGLSLLIAAELARLGARVVVIERSRAGVAHREWNASDEELVPLVVSGIVTAPELEELVVGRYREGLCAFHGGTPRRVRGVLDRAVDAGPLLERVRRVAEQRGVRFVDGASVDAVGAGAESVRVGWSRTQGSDERLGPERGEIVARMLVDARGASSPYASADLVCPTVGGVLRGLQQGDGPRQVDPSVGDILVTTEDVEDASGLQHVWEGFPGRSGDATVYLFYYARAANAPPGALATLYARFFETLATYKEGDAIMVRPTFGYIPGWSRLSPAPRAPSPRIILVGDAAARHSPLTFCGFGSMLRSFQPIALGIAIALERGRVPGPDVLPEDPVHMWTGALATVMASGALAGPKLNGLLDAAFGVLEHMGNDDFEALLKDRMGGRRFTEFLRLTGARHPVVYHEVLRALGPVAAARWGVRLARGAFS
jgi:lycopene cyclase CruA